MAKRNVIVSVVLVFLIVVSTSFAADANWEFKSEKKGVKIYTRPLPGTPYPEMKAEFEGDIPFEVAVELGKDYENYHNWYGMTKELKPIKVRSAEDFDVYFVLAMPILSDRDAVLKVKINNDSAKGLFTVTMKSFENDYGKENKLVRMPKVEGEFSVTRLSPTRSKIVYRVYADVTGSIPVKIVNIAATKHPLDTLIGAGEELRKNHKENKYIQRANKLHNQNFVVSLPK